MSWTLAELPDLKGRLVVVTGANSGLGLATTTALASRRAHVVMACRDTSKAERAARDIREEFPGAELELRSLDLASLESIRRFSDSLLADHPAIDVLINNAGIMAIPRTTTADGFEMQLGTNHLGHFALSLRLLPGLERAEAPRLVTVSSTMHRYGPMQFDDLMGERSYDSWKAYGQSKLANLLFSFELARKLETVEARTLAVAAHPGYAATNLQGTGARLSGSRLMEWMMWLGNITLAQSAEDGALPTLYAAAAPGVKSGEYFGPDGLLELTGSPKRCDSNERSKDLHDASELWNRSEALTGVRFPLS